VSGFGTSQIMSECKSESWLEQSLSGGRVGEGTKKCVTYG
jgi:hypothetical protein